VNVAENCIETNCIVFFAANYPENRSDKLTEITIRIGSQQNSRYIGPDFPELSA